MVVGMRDYEMSIEVLNGPFPASRWADAHGDALTEAALGFGATGWSWHRFAWGVVLELDFVDQDAWSAFRYSTAVTAALDAVPDPVWGRFVYRGRGGSSGSWIPRRPRPSRDAGAVEVPTPEPEAPPPGWVEAVEHLTAMTGSDLLDVVPLSA